MPQHYHSSFTYLVQFDDGTDTDLSVSSTKEEDYAMEMIYFGKNILDATTEI